MFRPLSEFFAQQPALSRIVLREMTFSASGAQAAAFQKTREALIELVSQAMAQKMFVSPEASQFVGWTRFWASTGHEQCEKARPSRSSPSSRSGSSPAIQRLTARTAAETGLSRVPPLMSHR